MDIEDFKKLDLKTQISLASAPNLYLASPGSASLKKYILSSSSILNAITQDALENNFNFASLPEFLQDKVVYANLDVIKVFSQSKQRAFLSDVKSPKTYRYLFSYLVMQNKLENLSSNEILAFMKEIKDMNIFKQVYHNPKIFNQLMRKTQIANSPEAYGYSNFSYLPVDFQIYILNDLSKREEYASQYAAFYDSAIAEAQEKAIKEKPSDFLDLAKSYVTTKDMHFKEEMLAKLADYDFTLAAYQTILDNYPCSFNIADLKAFFPKITLDIILTNAKNLKRYQTDADLKTLVIGKVFAAPDVPSYLLPKALALLDSKEQTELLDKMPKTKLLESSECPVVLNYITRNLEANNKYLKGLINMKLPEEQRPYLAPWAASVLAKYLTPAQRVYYLGADKLDIITREIDEDPRLIVYINKLTLLSWLNKIPINSYLYGRFPICKLISCLSWHQNDAIGRKIKDEFIKRGKASKLSADDFSLVFALLNAEDKRSLLLEGNPLDFIVAYEKEDNPEFIKAWADAICKSQDKIFKEDGNKDYWKILLKLSEDKLMPILKGLKRAYLLTLYKLWPSNKLENLIYDLFLDDNFLFNDLDDIDSFISSLSKEHERKIFYTMQDAFLTIGEKDERIYHLLDGTTSYSLLRFIKRYNDGFFASSTVYDTFVHLISQSPYLLKTINYDMLDEPFLSLGMAFLEKVLKYPDMQKSILKLKKQNRDSLEIFIRLLNIISQDEEKIFQRKMFLILERFSKQNWAFDYELSEKELDNLLRYLLLPENSPYAKDINPLTYADDIAKGCDEKLKDANSDYDLKDLIMQKYFDLSYEDAKSFLNTYDNNLETLDLDSDVLLYVKNMRQITQLKNLSKLYKIYRSLPSRHTLSDLYIIENELQKAFSLALKSCLFKDVKPNKNIQIAGKNVDVIAPGFNFKLLMHSTNGESTLTMVDDNYYKSWNAIKNTGYNAVYTTLVSGVCLGLPLLNDSKYGVIFGFNNLNANTLRLMAPYDLNLDRSNAQVINSPQEKFMTGNALEENTVHTHNEVILARSNPDEETGIIQPNYLVITSEMSENQKANSLLASKQMHGGKGLPIIYLDLAKIVSHQKFWILGKLNNFKMYHRIAEFKDALAVYELVRCTLYSIKNYDFIKTAYIDNAIKAYIKYCMTLTKTDKIKALMEMEEALTSEKAKFDLVSSKVNSNKSLDIDYAGFIETIYELLSAVDIKNDQEKIIKLSKEFSFANDESKLSIHDNMHMLRVTVLSQKIALLKGLDKESIFLLDQAAKNHDKGRIDDSHNIGHGQKGAEIYYEYSPYPNEVKNIVCAMIEYHEKPDSDATKEFIFDKYNIPLKQREYVDSLCAILKDADALDRIRFTNPYAILDPEKLRTSEAKLLIRYAKDLLNMTRQMRKGEKTKWYQQN